MKILGKRHSEIAIFCDSTTERNEIAAMIHEALKGQKDYIESNIVLNRDEDNVVYIEIFSECTEVPESLKSILL